MTSLSSLLESSFIGSAAASGAGAPGLGSERLVLGQPPAARARDQALKSCGLRVLLMQGQANPSMLCGAGGGGKLQVTTYLSNPGYIRV